MEPSELSLNVCFSRTTAFQSRLIRWVTRAEVSHVLITFRSLSLGRVMVMEAVGRGFLLFPWERWKQKNQLVARYACVGVPHEDQAAALQKLGRRLGDEYDRVSLIGFICRRWRRRARNPFNATRKLFCSEAVALFLREAGFPEFERPNEWAPGDILEHVRANPDSFRFVEDPDAVCQADANTAKAT